LLEDTGGINTIWRTNVQQAVDYINGFPQGKEWMVIGRSAWDDEFNEAVTTAALEPAPMTCQQRIALMNAF